MVRFDFPVYIGCECKDSGPIIKCHDNGVTLGLHLCHGFWSAFQTIGLSNQIWEKRLYCLGKIFVGIIVLGFSAVAVNAFLQANGYIG